MASTYNTVTVTSSPTLILASNLNRRGCEICNNGSVTMFVGMDSSVTISNGLPISTSSYLENSDLQAAYRGSIYGITAGTSVNIRYWEWE